MINDQSFKNKMFPLFVYLLRACLEIYHFLFAATALSNVQPVLRYQIINNLRNFTFFKTNIRPFSRHAFFSFSFSHNLSLYHYEKACASHDEISPRKWTPRNVICAGIKRMEFS